MLYPKEKRTCSFIVLLILLPLISAGTCLAQPNHLFKKDTTIDPAKTKELSLEFDATPFFKNNEFKGNFIEGYSLPGFNMEVKGVYQPTNKIRLETGLYLLRFWGAEKYPSFAYSDIAQWKGDQYQRGVHILIFLTAQFNLAKGFDIVIGNIHGKGNHNLMLPLYNPELNLIADPEAGLQLLYSSSWFDGDLWLNWESFLFEDSEHQEAFTVGLSSQFRANRKDAPLHVYFPLQAVIQHRGGEINVPGKSVQTYVNAATGVGARWNANYRRLKSMSLDLNLLGFYQQKGGKIPFDTGGAFYVQASADLSPFYIKGGYFQANDFMSLLGSPFFGTVSLSEENFYFQGNKMIYGGAGYVKNLGKGYTMGIDIDLFHHFSAKASTPEGIIKQNSATSFTAGIYFRINPSLLLKRF